MLTPSTFYKRPLPSVCVPFASDEGRRLFQEALSDGTMAGYFALAEQFHTQADPAFCGLGTLVVVLNALAIDPGPGRPWKGPWRWFAEEHLDCCRPLPEIQRTGLSIPQLACLARCNGARVEVRHAESAGIEAFRQAVHEAASTPGEPHLVVSYDRGTLGQTGSGHYSPVGGYHAGRDLVLILDVARFKYPPHWVPLDALFRALQPIDSETGRSRGFLRFWRRSPVASLCSLRASETGWDAVLRPLLDAEALDAVSTEDLLQRLLQVLPRQALDLVTLRTPESSAPPDVAAAHAALWQQLEQTEILQRLRTSVPNASVDLGRVALLLLTLPGPLLRCLPPDLRDPLDRLLQPNNLPPLVFEQVEYLRAQAEALAEARTPSEVADRATSLLPG